MSSPAPASRIIVADRAALAVTAAQRLMARIEANTARVAICLTGGSSPKQLYRLLASGAWSKRVPWNRVHWFWGDERFVPHDHPDSNFRMAREAFLSRVPVPAENIHPVPTEGTSPQDAAASA